MYRMFFLQNIAKFFDSKYKIIYKNCKLAHIIKFTEALFHWF
jgi:hypothetical protein